MVGRFGGLAIASYWPVPARSTGTRGRVASRAAAAAHHCTPPPPPPSIAIQRYLCSILPSSSDSAAAAPLGGGIWGGLCRKNWGWRAALCEALHSSHRPTRAAIMACGMCSSPDQSAQHQLPCRLLRGKPS